MSNDLSERSRGPYRLLRSPSVYRAVQRALGGGEHSKSAFVRRYIRPRGTETIIDFGAGTGSIRDFLPAGVTYIAIEPNPAYCDAMARDLGPDRVTVRQGTVEALESVTQVADIVLVLAVLHHVPDREAARILAAARGALRPHGRLVTIDPCVHEGQDPVARVLAKVDRGQFVRSPDEYERLARSSFSEVLTIVQTDGLRVPYSHCILQCHA